MRPRCRCRSTARSVGTSRTLSNGCDLEEDKRTSPEPQGEFASSFIPSWTTLLALLTRGPASGVVSRSKPDTGRGGTIDSTRKKRNKNGAQATHAAARPVRRASESTKSL